MPVPEHCRCVYPDKCFCNQWGEDDMPVSARSSVERWECPDCGRVLLPGEQKPRRSYHHWQGVRCDGEWQKVRYVPESEVGRLREFAEYAKATFHALEWPEGYERAREALNAS